MNLRAVKIGAQAPCQSFVQTQHAASPKLTPRPPVRFANPTALAKRGGRNPAPDPAPRTERGGFHVAQRS
jgi:hypothetical protein